MTPLFSCGAECGHLPQSGQPSVHMVRTSGGGTAEISTSVVRSGTRSFRCFNTTANTANITTIPFGASGRWIGRVYIYFAVLPSVSVPLVSFGNATGPHVYFNQSESKLYARVGTTSGASGVSVTTDVWYRLDFDFNIQTAGNDVCDVQVEGTACGQATATGLSSNATAIIWGNVGTNAVMDVYFDDLILSNTAADYPIGAGQVLPLVPTADGSHNVAGSNDFERGTGGVDIVNATTDSYQLLDDFPLPLTVVTDDFVNMIAPPNAGDFVEYIFGAAPGITLPATSARNVEIVAAIHQAGTGAGNMALQWGNATFGWTTWYEAIAVTGSTALQWKINHSTTNGDLVRDGTLRVRFGSPTAGVDANPDQYLDAVLVEAEFPPGVPNGYGVSALTLGAAGAGVTVKKGSGAPALTLSTAAAGVAVHKGAASSALTLGSAAAGVAVHYGSASSTVTLGAQGTGEAPAVGPNEGTGTAALTLTTAAAGATVQTGEASSALTLGTAAAGVAVHYGEASSALTLGSAAAGATAYHGTGTAALTLGAQGASAGTSVGSGSSALTLGTVAAGVSAHYGEASSALTLGSAAAGVAIHSGSTAHALTLGAQATGEAPAVGVSEGSGVATLGLSATGAGVAVHQGQASSALTLGAQATGDAPTLAASEGFGVAPLALSTTAAGATVKTGAASSALTLGATAAGLTVRSGEGIAALDLEAIGFGPPLIIPGRIVIRAAGEVSGPIAGAAGSVHHAIQGAGSLE